MDFPHVSLCLQIPTPNYCVNSPYCHSSCSFLDDVGSAGEHAQEFLELMKGLIKDSSGKWKSYLAMRGVLPQIGALITREIEHLQHLEETTLNSDLSQGCALKMLTGKHGHMTGRCGPVWLYHVT